MKIPTFPARFVEMPSSTEGKRAAFYLAAEEYVARHLPADNYLFTWQLSPTVVMGRNQVAHQEVDMDFCRAEGIDVIRRKSGGGCIFADHNNIMVSLVTRAGAVEPLFREYAEQVAACLRGLGAPAQVEGRNDITLEGRKICGNAFYHLADSNIVHGTMLYDTDQRLMAGALTPDKEKLTARGVASVKSRVGFLKDYLSIGVAELRQELRSRLCDRTIRLTDDDVQYIKAIEADYYDPEYLYGKAARQDRSCGRRIPDCGHLHIRVGLALGKIEQVTLSGDYFEEGDAGQAFCDALCGLEPNLPTLRDAVGRHHPEKSIRGLSEEALLDLLADLC